MDDSDFCCGCCLGLAFGYFIWHGADAHGESLPQMGNLEDTTSVAVKSGDGFLLKQIANYQNNISQRIKENFGKDRLCKFEPSCSEYTKAAIKKYGSIKGSLKATKRLLRCNPFSKGGYDPLK